MHIPKHKADFVLWNPGQGHTVLHANWSGDSRSLLPLWGDDTAGLVFVHSLCLFMCYIRAIYASALEQENAGFILRPVYVVTLVQWVPYMHVLSECLLMLKSTEGLKLQK